MCGTEKSLSHIPAQLRMFESAVILSPALMVYYKIHSYYLNSFGWLFLIDFHRCVMPQTICEYVWMMVAFIFGFVAVKSSNDTFFTHSD